MVSQARARFLRISPRKLREVTSLLKGMRADEALLVLASLNKRAAKAAAKAVASAIANAKQGNSEQGADKLYISKIVVDEGPFLKRYRAMSMGRAGMIRRRTSHLLVELDRLTKKIPRQTFRRRKIVKKSGEAK